MNPSKNIEAEKEKPDKIFCILYDEGVKRTLYCESLRPKILNSRFKIIRRNLTKQLIIDAEAL